jgi:hypothetical protein
MKLTRIIATGLAVLAGCAALEMPVSGQTTPGIASLSVPRGGDMQLIFHGGTGPFQVQRRNSIQDDAPWFDVPEARITEVNTGVFLAVLPSGADDAAFYRIVSADEAIIELKGWNIRLGVSPPANGQFFVAGEAPVVTVTLLDNFAQGLTRAGLSSLNLYMAGPQDPRSMITPLKLLNANPDRAARPHHYIDLKTNPDVQAANNIYTYRLKPITDEKPGTYTLSLWAVRGSDAIQQVMRFADIQIGTATVETPVITSAKCAACHKGAISGKMYAHHVDIGRSPVGNWALDYDPQRSCFACHNNDGYAAYTDTNAPGGRVPDTLVRRVHGVHMGEHLKNPFNTDPNTGDFRHYTHVLFPADVRNCATCHADDRWKTKASRMACGSCHDATWFGPETAIPAGMEAHEGGPAENDNSCSICHSATQVVRHHAIPEPSMDPINLSLTPPANGKYYVPGEKPAVSVVILDDTGTNAIDHTKVTDGNFSTASLFVYGPRARSVPVLTSAAKNGNSKLRASVSNNKDGPWEINGKVFKISVNGGAPQEITISGAGAQVTPAEVVASLNAVITNLNGGARASVSGARVNIRSLIQGPGSRFEIYNGDVTAAMVWKRPPNTVLEPDVTIAQGQTQGNDLRELSDPLDFSDPKVTRAAANITYQLDDVAGLPPGTYMIYAYHIPRTGKIPGLAKATGVGFTTFQVGTATAEKKVATNCRDCHGDTIFHLASGPIHAEPFDTDYCNACHDYGHLATGELFKNQGGTSLSGWSGYGAMPISRRTHAVHKGRYLDYPEEIYANATRDTFGNIIFSQDVRNCTKCHAESDTWKQKPSRLACLACHDSDAAKAHGNLMTYIPDRSDPYGPLSQESCEVCHGAGTEFSPDKVHRITNPYVPPYPREPEN